ncbi:MAG TPA: Chromate resistance protein ChrB [Actinomycetota bacterium]|nr:Chromate resistance protein ChrB [Actinomycetota bacterium]
MDWWTISYRLPAEPSRWRVSAWRRLKRGGAVALQQATWSFPAGQQFDPMVDDVVALVAEAGGESFVFRGEPQGDTAGRLEEQFTAARNEEWTEFLGDCAKYDREIASEIAKGKFTYAELEEEEQTLERLRRWHRRIRTRDVFGSPHAAEAEVRLKEVAEALERYADQVFDRGGT